MLCSAMRLLDLLSLTYKRHVGVTELRMDVSRSIAIVTSNSKSLVWTL